MKKKIPDFKSDKEIAEFWGNHSITDFEEELEIVKNPIFIRPKRQTITIRMDKKYLDIVKAISSKKGIGHSALIRMWIMEKINQARTIDISRS